MWDTGDPDFISRTQRSLPGFCGGDMDDMMAHVKKVGWGLMADTIM